MSDVASELASFFEGAELSAETISRYADGAHASAHARERFAELVPEYARRSDRDALRVALGYLIAGKNVEALEWFD